MALIRYVHESLAADWHLHQFLGVDEQQVIDSFMTYDLLFKVLDRLTRLGFLVLVLALMFQLTHYYWMSQRSGREF